ncbi:MAG: ribonuclease P protein component [Gammaproteobacteria bacterium RIFCSPHIGHO2_02_FULL_42_13]|nr:MAG: ribonuclease P protein component [Gammaproteobacteria bacterium RIFCSPHIGHO2_02_FULL_42_13]OGT69683.1 MAG: ribonuclease P protein component [Gammaproteobacteria bacterium RIFCSPLOWO2_02_FULL_42_9]
MKSASLQYSKNYRLLCAKEFEAVFSKGKKIFDRSLMLVVSRNQLKNARLGLIVSKKTGGKLAVDRNRIKRVIRESFRHQQHQLDGLDIVVVTRSGANNVTNSDLRLELDKQWDRLKQQFKLF